jgi:hypothetical protein
VIHKGQLVQDQITIGKISVKDHVFVEILDAGGRHYPFDGFVGLARPISSEAAVPNFLQRAKQQGLVASLSFAVMYAAEETEESHIILGGYDSRYVERDFFFYPRLYPNTWHVRVKLVVLGMKTFSHGMRENRVVPLSGQVDSGMIFSYHRNL